MSSAATRRPLVVDSSGGGGAVVPPVELGADGSTGAGHEPDVERVSRFGTVDGEYVGPSDASQLVELLDLTASESRSSDP